MKHSEVKRRAEKRAFIHAFKEMVGCKDCGTAEGRLDFDHRDKATKKFKVACNLGLSWRSVLAEIEKCDVRCAPCHTKRHHRDDPPRRRRKANPTHCRNGHPLTPTSTVLRSDGYRRCVNCLRERREAA